MAKIKKILKTETVKNDYDFIKLYCWCNTQNTSTFVLQLSVILKGPGWTPGKPRLGDPGDIPEVCNEFALFVNFSILHFLHMYLFMS